MWITFTCPLFIICPTGDSQDVENFFANVENFVIVTLLLHFIYTKIYSIPDVAKPKCLTIIAQKVIHTDQIVNFFIAQFVGIAIASNVNFVTVLSFSRL
jgi:hypothetical protein